MSFTSNASEEAGRIVVAMETEMISGKREIGSAAAKNPISANVRNFPMTMVQML
jgi:hypothetical protein